MPIKIPGLFIMFLLNTMLLFFKRVTIIYYEIIGTLVCESCAVTRASFCRLRDLITPRLYSKDECCILLID